MPFWNLHADSSRRASWIESVLESPRGRFAVVSVVCLLALVAGLGSVGLWGTREKRVAACVADIVYDGHWLLPQLRDEPRLEKPPLPYWMIAAFSELTGRTNEWTLRLPGALAALVIVFLTYSLAREAGGPRAGLLASLALATSVYFITEARQASSDLYLACFTSCALACWWKGYGKPERRGVWWPAAGLCTGLGLLCKGPVALVVIGPPVVGFLVWERDFRLPRSKAAWTGILLAVSVGLAWPLAVFLLRPDAWVTWVQELDRKVAREDAWGRTWFFYLLEWPQYLFPWSALSVAAVFLPFRQPGQGRAPLVRFAWLWFFGDLILFSLATARKQYYLLPAVPGLAVLVGHLVARLDCSIRQAHTNRFIPLLVHAQFLMLVALGLGSAAASIIMPTTTNWSGLCVGAVLAVVFACLWRMGPSCFALGKWVAASVLLAGCVGGAYTFILPYLDREHSQQGFSRRIAAVLPADAPLYYIGEVDASFWFYFQDRLRPLPLRPLGSASANEPYYFLMPEQKRKSRRFRLPQFDVLLKQESYWTGTPRALLCRTGEL